MASLVGLEAGGGYGVAHSDDLHYLFNPHLPQVEYPALGTPVDLSVRYLIGTLYSIYSTVRGTVQLTGLKRGLFKVSSGFDVKS